MRRPDNTGRVLSTVPEHSELPRVVVSIRKGALQYTDVFLAGLSVLPEKAAK